MLAIAPAIDTAAAVPVPVVARRLRPALIVEGRICSHPRRLFSATGAAAAWFRVECDSLPDDRLRALALRGTSTIDVTMWGADAMRVVDQESMNRIRYSLIRQAQDRLVRDGFEVDEAAARVGWQVEDRFIAQLRRGVRVVVEGTPRAGRWHPVGLGWPVPFGVIAECVRPRGAATPV